MERKLVINFDDVAGQSARVLFNNIGDKTNEEASTLVTDLAGHLNAGVKSYSITEVYERSGTDDTDFPMPAETEFNTIDQKNVFSYRRSIGDGEDKDTISSTIELPAPLAAEFEVVKKQGKRLIQEMGEDIATSIGTFYGESTDAVFVEGWLKSKK